MLLALRCRTLLLLLAALTLASPLLAETPAAQTLTGTFLWEQGEEQGNLKAVFTPAEKAGSWQVAFHFQFQGQPHTYSGTAVGQLGQGSLSGRVHNEEGHRAFTFQGEFRDGRFQGNHAEVKGGGEQRTGTLSLGKE